MTSACGAGPGGPGLQLLAASVLTMLTTPLAAQQSRTRANRPRYARITWYGREVSATPVLWHLPVGLSRLPRIAEPSGSQPTAHSIG
jgi:hypothetical protein